MDNLVPTNPGNIKSHVVHSNRKRVQCALPNCGDLFDKQSNELNKNSCESENNGDDDLFQSNEKHCQEDPIYKEVSYQGAEPSSPQFSTNQSTQQKLDAHKKNPTDGRIIKKMKLTKNQQGVLRDTTAMTRQVLTLCKGAGYMVDKQPPIKVGSTVLLETSNYPNKAIVAYATLLSSSPKAQAGGVEIGKEFYKVHINHPTIQEEPLVRPMTGYRTIGHAHAKGIPIAWPLICVEMING